MLRNRRIGIDICRTIAVRLQGSELEVKTTYEYVLELKVRLQSTCELAQIELQMSQIRQKKYYYTKTKVRTFEKGDEVLVLLPTDSNKLLLQWKGPF